MKLPNNKWRIIYLDQFASSSMFESEASEWVKIKTLIKEGFMKNKLICPLSAEHYFETSQKSKDKAVSLDIEYHNISGGYMFKQEFYITAQLMASLVRNNNITQKTFLIDNVSHNILSKEDNFDILNREKQTFNNRIKEGTSFVNDIRKVAREINANKSTRKLMIDACKAISISHFVNRLNDLIHDGHIIIRGVPFSSGDVPHWIDQILFRLTNKHKIMKSEVLKLIKELESNGFNNIPTLDIRESLTALISVSNKKETASDQIDIMRISTGLPFSDFLFTDSTRKNEIEELGLDRKYNTKVFSGKKADLDKFIVELEDVICDN